MKGLLETMKNITIIEPTVSVKVKLSEENEKQLSEIAKQFA